MSTQDQEYMKMHLEWRADITGNEEIVIDESVFEEIYKLQEEEYVPGNYRDRVSGHSAV